MTITKDAIFQLRILPNNDHTIHIYNRTTTGTHDVKDVIPNTRLRSSMDGSMQRGNCFYVGLRRKTYPCLSVFRISRDADHTCKFHMLPWIQDHKGCISMMSVSAKGSLIILTVPLRCPDVVSIYNANGSFQCEIMLSPDASAFIYSSIIQKSNGNVVLAYVTKQNPQIQLLEIDTGESIVRQYQSSMREWSCVNSADVLGRIIMTDQREGIELLDSEFNSLGTYSLLLNGAQIS